MSQLEVQESWISRFYNERGLLRLWLVRDYYGRVAPDLDLPRIVDLYRKWRDQAEYLVLERVEVHDPDLRLDRTRIAVKCSKRGNDVHGRRISKRISWMDRVRNLDLLPEDLGLKGLPRSRVLFFTLTYDVHRCGRLEAWTQIGAEYDRWISHIRSRYGPVGVFRVFQSTASGYPHVHGVLVFQRSSFKVFRWKDVDGRVSYRIADKGDLQGSWHSFVDVVAVKSLRGAMAYCKRYMTRQTKEAEISRPILENGTYSDLDLALCWLFRKRSFSISGYFKGLCYDLIAGIMHNSRGQVTLERGPVWGWVRWIVVGVFSACELGVDGGSWTYVEGPAGWKC